MRKKLPLVAAVLLAITAFAAPATAAPPIPPQSAAAQLQSGAVKFTVLSIPGAQAEDRTAILDQLLAEWGWPGPNTMLLLRFPDANHDIRFAMGAGFTQNGLTVDEMLKLIRTQYLPTAKSGDPEGALHNLMTTITQRMGSTDEISLVTTPSVTNAINKTWTLLRQNDAKALAAMASDKLTGEPGVVIAPMAKELANPGIAGAELVDALDKMLANTQPEVVASWQIDDQLILMVEGLNPVEITPTGGNPVRITDLVQIALGREEDDSWKLLYIATDNGTFAEKIRK